MRTKIAIGLFLGVLLLALAQAAGAQGPDTVPFKEQEGQLQGQILMVGAQTNLLFVERNNIPFSFQITPATKITVSTQRGNLEALAARKGQTVTVKYRATRKGNIAKEIVVP